MAAPLPSVCAACLLRRQLSSAAAALRLPRRQASTSARLLATAPLRATNALHPALAHPILFRRGTHASASSSPSQSPSQPPSSHPPPPASSPPSPLPAPSAWRSRAATTRGPSRTGDSSAPDQDAALAAALDDPATPTVAALNPRASPTTGAPLHVAITPRAARRLALLMRADGAPALALRVAVSSGGCHGFQYGVSVDSTARLDADEDTLFVYGRPRGEASLGEGLPKVVMDRASLELLDGSSVDYTTELIGSQFKIVDNPRAVSSCGCGTSFDVKTPDRASPWG